ncbi:MAG: hypothetical protein KC636_23400 [Myxococcales bacterium]|nr:hypothetical protein [Myxococcales bacterium]
MVRRSRARVFVVLAALVAGCGDAPATTTDDATGTTEPENPDPHVTLEATVDVFDLCGVTGSQSLSLRATRINCEQDPPPPCTLPKNPFEVVFGDAKVCENPTETAAVMRLTLEQSGRYLIEVVAVTDSGEVGTCFGLGGDPETLITQAQLDARETVAVSTLGAGPCPPTG